MLATCSVFISSSLDGFIARTDGSIDWLEETHVTHAISEDYGYQSFISNMDALIMGRCTYEKVLSFDTWPYSDISVIVLSNHPLEIPKHLQNDVSSTVETPQALVHRLSKQGAKQLYIDGGITIQSFLAADLISELTITLIPVLLGGGRSLFGSLKKDIKLYHVSTHVFDNGFIQVKYHLDSNVMNHPIL